MPLVCPKQMAGISNTPSSPCVGTGYSLSFGISPSSTLSPFISSSHLWSHQMMIFFCGLRMLVMAHPKCSSWCVWNLLLGIKLVLLLAADPQTEWKLSSEDPNLTSRKLSGEESLKIWRGDRTDRGVKQLCPSQNTSNCSDNSLRACGTCVHSWQHHGIIEYLVGGDL